MITARRAWLYLAVTFAVTFFVASGPIAAQAAPAGTNSVKDWRAQVDALCTESNAVITQAYRAVTIGSDGEPLPAEFSTFMVTQLHPNFSQLVAAIKTTPAPKKKFLDRCFRLFRLTTKPKPSELLMILITDFVARCGPPTRSTEQRLLLRCALE